MSVSSLYAHRTVAGDPSWTRSPIRQVTSDGAVPSTSLQYDAVHALTFAA